MRLKEARFFYDLITAHELTSILELGFFHGVSTAYLAGAVQQVGDGHVTTIDLTTAMQRKPNIEEILTTCGLRNLVEIFYEPKTFNWRLMKFLEEEPRRSFDLCYIDGGHTWVDTGFAFCLVRQLLRPGGWLVFDDIPHTFRTSSNRDKPWVLRMSEEEQVIPQVDRVFSLLTLKDNGFDTFRRINRLGIARKRPDSVPSSPAALFVETQVCAAAHLARTDPALRHRLLQQPARVLSEVSGREERLFRHVRFAESTLWSALEPDLGENGILTHFLEKPEWDKSISEESLLELMHD
jgi:predicted O-methyltransferase YrrM